MQIKALSRRAALTGAVCVLGGCSALSSLNSASEPLDTYDLRPAAGSKAGRRTSRTLLVARPDAPAAMSTDRIMVKPAAAAITYLPDARWSDEAPLVLQSLLIRSIAGTDRIGYVGRSEGGPVPDTALLVRMDEFEVTVMPEGMLNVGIDVALTLLSDRDQRVIANRSFSGTAIAPDDSALSIVRAFQSALDTLLPEMADWAVARA
ncbi:ABC-type transport auxiliary lipoprotein family protein [uncultured Sulfitobacter sp.]|uniref:ABC-type transport auxiliary lipoprotein family protein n=1 Tax=uncultured Sulfitobacter sp. TaxID=191468 RepID=UPI00260D92A8|nr:ABC-type transport auxiliary lipoprotein family protein [uncultured Sulfitobacter sp.]